MHDRVRECAREDEVKSRQDQTSCRHENQKIRRRTLGTHENLIILDKTRTYLFKVTLLPVLLLPKPPFKPDSRTQ